MKLSPYMDQIGALFKMPISWHVVFQTVAILTQAANAIAPMFAPNTKTEIMLGISAVQATLAFVAHFRNPDGTKITAPANADNQAKSAGAE